MQHLIQVYVDKSVAHPKERWAAFSTVLFLFLFRVYYTDGYRLVTYCLFLYLLHCFIGFCTPIDSEVPDPFDIDETEAFVESPIKRSGDESKPFLRRLPEFSYWMFSMQAVIASFFITYLPFLNIPVYTPILVVYFCVLVYLTAIKIKKHMEKYKYNPFFNAKKIYKGILERK
ncbi:hypothetical protein NEFER03_1472 [Nematocida sp. LUAm3]|nr:hypothetical protein NEFER03_1472 [Nematocida sp. LUAm3]KAI5174698.1 hypothetical protein NEFER02_0808 [Nematocida sp. LUAm2]KAI5177891.1 hypothetical protein NEFER01_1093 [Nematocida sp. LUAm1]